MKKYLFFLIIAGIFPVTGCLDPIDLEVPATERETLVIQAKLSKGNPSVVDAIVNRLFDFTPSSRIPVTVREVLLIDEDGSTKVLAPTSSSGYRAIIAENDAEMSIEYGKSYKIKVSTFDNRVFESDLETLLPVPTPEELYFKRGTTKDDSTGVDLDIAQIFVSTGLNTDIGTQSKSKMRWEVELAYQATDAPVDGTEPKTCWITNIAELSKIKVVDGNEISGDRIEDLLIAELKVGPDFAEGVYVNVYQESLTEPALLYWQQLGELVERSGNMFEAPVGKLETNFRNANEGIKDEIFGYFYATSREVIRVYIDPSEVGNPASICPWTGRVNPGRGCNIPEICCDCSLLKGSSTVKPEYWVK
jgi:hypothetical protein